MGVTRGILGIHVRLVAWSIPLLDRVFSLNVLVRLARPPRWVRPYRGLDIDAIRQSTGKALANPRQMKRRSCLRLGLVLFHFLRLAGRPAVLNFSIGPPGRCHDCLHAHCWVTVGERVFDAPTPDSGMKRIWRYPEDLDPEARST